MKFFLTNWLLASALNLPYYASANSTLRGSFGHNPPSTNHRVLEEEETGTYLVAEIEYSEEGSFDEPEQTYNIELPNGLTYQLTNANPAWMNGNRKSLESGKSKIKIGKGAVIVGEKVDLRGGAPEEVKGLFGRSLEDTNHRKLSSTIGTRSVLAVRVIASDGQYGFDEAVLSDEVFGTSGDPVNLVSQYKACSFDQLNFAPAQRPGITDGVVTITVSTSTTEGDAVMRNAITDEINRVFGVSSPRNIADHVMYCLPSGTMEGIAYAYINSWNSVYSNEWCNYVSGQMHEIGHNLNFAHSNEAGSYKDQSGMMGYSYSNDDGPKMCFNSAKSFQSGWYHTKTVTPVTADCGGFEGQVYGLSDFGTVGGTTVVKINDITSGSDFFINYNKKEGVNFGTVEGGNQVMITSVQSGEGTEYAYSELLAKLSVGQSYVISNFEGIGKDVSVTFDSLDDSVSPKPARVVISYDGLVCGSSTSSPTTMPPSNSPTTMPPTASPTNPPPTQSPTKNPTLPPTTLSPSTSPTVPPPTKSPTHSPTSRPTTLSPTPEPCWESGTQCDPRGVHNCCKGCQAKGRNAGFCK